MVKTLTPGLSIMIVAINLAFNSVDLAAQVSFNRQASILSYATRCNELLAYFKEWKDNATTYYISRYERNNCCKVRRMQMGRRTLPKMHVSMRMNV